MKAHRQRARRAASRAGVLTNAQHIDEVWILEVDDGVSGWHVGLTWLDARGAHGAIISVPPRDAPKSLKASGLFSPAGQTLDQCRARIQAMVDEGILPGGAIHDGVAEYGGKVTCEHHVIGGDAEKTLLVFSNRPWIDVIGLGPQSRSVQ